MLSEMVLIHPCVTLVPPLIHPIYTLATIEGFWSLGKNRLRTSAVLAA